MAEHTEHDDHHDDHDDHGDHPVHQAPWVTVATICITFGITFMLLFLKSFGG